MAREYQIWNEDLANKVAGAILFDILSVRFPDEKFKIDIARRIPGVLDLAGKLFFAALRNNGYNV